MEPATTTIASTVATLGSKTPTLFSMKENNAFKLIIAGSRTFNDYDVLKKEVDEFLSEISAVEMPIEIVSGGATGADSLGERYAKERHLPIRVFKADWDKDGKAAGPIRNKEMAKYSHGLVAFWDQKSSGTANMIAVASINGLAIKVYAYKGR